MPVAAFNHLRFDTWNPISYGPCVWEAYCRQMGDVETVKVLLRSAAPHGIWLLMTLVGLWLARRSRPALIGVAGLSLLPLILLPTVRQSLYQAVELLWFVLFDSTAVYGRGMQSFADGIGSVAWDSVWAWRSLFQASPHLILALLCPLALRQQGRGWLALALPSLCIVASQGLRASMDCGLAMGGDWLFPRYLAWSFPLLSVLALQVAWRLPWHRRHALGLLLLTMGLALWLSLDAQHGDGSLLRRLVLLPGVTLLNAATLLLGGRWLLRGRGATWVMRSSVLALALALALHGTVHLRASLYFANLLDRDVQIAAPLFTVPVGLIGRGAEFYHVLSLRGEYDIRYAWVDEYADLGRVGHLLTQWRRDGRTLYGIGLDRPIPGYVERPLRGSITRLEPVQAR